MLCTSCRQAYNPSANELAELRFPLDHTGIPTLYRPVGCNHCARTGYRGRMALHEVMRVTEEIERLGVARATAEEISRQQSRTA